MSWLDEVQQRVRKDQAVQDDLFGLQDLDEFAAAVAALAGTEIGDVSSAVRDDVRAWHQHGWLT